MLSHQNQQNRKVTKSKNGKTGKQLIGIIIIFGIIIGIIIFLPINHLLLVLFLSNKVKKWKNGKTINWHNYYFWHNYRENFFIVILSLITVITKGNYTNYNSKNVTSL